ncbi:MAG TPA: hypothetical protein VFZ73_10825 [Gemmatimonadaceae bacterium]
MKTNAFATDCRERPTGASVAAIILKGRRLRITLAITVSLVACGGESSRTDASISTDTTRSAGAAIVSALPLRALGTEPFWALDIETSELRLRTPDDTAGVQFPAGAPTIAGDTASWTAQRDTVAIEANVWPGTCSDGMSDRQYPYTVRVSVAGTLYHGCADRRETIAR